MKIMQMKDVNMKLASLKIVFPKKSDFFEIKYEFDYVEVHQGAKLLRTFNSLDMLCVWLDGIMDTLTYLESKNS